ncbi:hypothetical protein DID88_004750 [Monilinia fructigena]|uniref:Uncharacterized protein n=1 Tax=Monilinia fructigena TaxID=38457 RepID=A0A395IX18_9HELO|nr:hypothetical protein DID88_004750 [Monilinia fructigena]
MRDNFSMGVSGSVQTPLGVTTGEDKIIGDKMFESLQMVTRSLVQVETKMDHQFDRKPIDDKDAAETTKWDEGGDNMDLFFDGP